MKIPNVRKKWPCSLEGMLYLPNHYGFTGSLEERIQAAIARSDLPIEKVKHVTAYYLWDQHGRKSFIMGKEFTEALIEAKGTFHTPNFPENFGCEILVPKFDPDSESGDPLNSFVVAYERSIPNQSEPGMIIYASCLHEGKPLSVILPGDIRDGKFHCSRVQDQDIEMVSILTDFVMRAVVYLYSSDPDVLQIAPPRQPVGPLTRRERDRITQANSELPGLAYNLVSWSWRRPQTRHVSETIVKGHFRWQPCGKGWSKTKLIWIDEHLREFEDNQTD